MLIACAATLLWSSEGAFSIDRATRVVVCKIFTEVYSFAPLPVLLESCLALATMHTWELCIKHTVLVLGAWCCSLCRDGSTIHFTWVAVRLAGINWQACLSIVKRFETLRASTCVFLRLFLVENALGKLVTVVCVCSAWITHLTRCTLRVHQLIACLLAYTFVLSWTFINTLTVRLTSVKIFVLTIVHSLA